jgi:hypothetical protein
LDHFGAVTRRWLTVTGVVIDHKPSGESWLMNSEDPNKFYFEIELLEEIRNVDSGLAEYLEQHWDKVAPVLYDHSRWLQLLLISDIKDIAWKDKEEHQIDDATQDHIISLLQRAEDMIFAKFIHPDHFERETWEKEDS